MHLWFSFFLFLNSGRNECGDFQITSLESLSLGIVKKNYPKRRNKSRDMSSQCHTGAFSTGSPKHYLVLEENIAVFEFTIYYLISPDTVKLRVNLWVSYP